MPQTERAERIDGLKKPVRPGHGAWVYIGLAGALLLALAAAWPLLAVPGIVNTRAGGDSPFLLQRLYELQANLRAGVFPARWMPDAAYGLGYPFFNFYAALPYYVGTLLSLAGAGLLWSIKLTQLIGFLGAAAAMYALALALWDDPAAALLASAAYTFAPFHLANVYVRGDSLSEFTAFALYPLILWGVVRLQRSPTPGRIAVLALSYAALMITHNISALIFTPLAGAALLAAALSARGRRWRVLVAGAAAFILGAALSAWFWAPALLEQGAVSLTDMTTGYFNYSLHFRGLNLVQSAFLFNYTLDGQRTPFVLGGVQAAVTLLGLAAVVVGWLRARRVRWLDLGILLALVYAVWPITPSSAWLWAHVPLLPMVQFPWRFLSIAALVAALVAGAGLARLPGRPYLAGAGALLLAGVMLARLPVEPLPLRDSDVTPARLQLYEQFTGNIGTTVRAEYLPQDAIPRPYSAAALLSGAPYPQPLAAEGSLGKAQLLSGGPTAQSWQVTVNSRKAVLAFQTYDFPGWQAAVDGQPVAIDAQAANGRIAIPVTAGEHRVDLSFGNTPLRTRAEQLSLAALLITLALCGWALARSRTAWRAPAAALGLIVLALALGAVLGRVGAQSPEVCQTMDFIRLPYLHPNPQGVAFGSDVRLLSYELTPQAAHAGDTVHLTLHWQAPTGSGLTVVVRATTPAEALLGAPSLRRTEAPLAAVTEHTLTVPAETAPGLLLLAVEVQGPQGLVIPHTGQGADLGTTYLAPIRVLPPAAPAGAPAVALGEMNKQVEVLSARVEQPAPGLLDVYPTWRLQAPLPEDYVASVRLLDPDGVEVTKTDRQPRYGLYPTSLWPVGVPIADFCRLSIPPGTPPGAGYRVELVLYQARQILPLGSVQVPGITLTQTTIDPSARLLQTLGGLGVTGWRIENMNVEDGEQVTADIQWTALQAPLADGQYRLSLLDEQGKEVASSQADLSPRYPPSRWPLHALVNERLALRVPPGSAPGRYRLQLEIRDASGSPLGRWKAPGVVQVKAAPRHTELPPLASPLGIDFGNLIRLTSFDLQQQGDQITVHLQWQALQAPGRDYKVFLHCVDPKTGEIVAQHDAQPVDNTYPTGRWAAGEMVNDQLTLDLSQAPAGAYALYTGLYDANTGERLEPAGKAELISDGRVKLGSVERNP